MKLNIMEKMVLLIGGIAFTILGICNVDLATQYPLLSHCVCSIGGILLGGAFVAFLP